MLYEVIVTIRVVPMSVRVPLHIVCLELWESLVPLHGLCTPLLAARDFDFVRLVIAILEYSLVLQPAFLNYAI